MCRLHKPVFADDVFAFTLPATVAIRDWRLGVLHKFFLVLVFAYVVVYELLINEGFRKPVDITGAVRVVLRNPEPAARLQPCPAYCLDTFQQCGGASQPFYNISADRANYTYLGGGGVPAPRRACPYADSAWVQTDSLQPEGVFIPTTIAVRHQQVQPAGYPCADFQLGLPTCAYNTTNATTIMIPDAEEFVLRIDHSFATTSGLTRTSRQIRSILLGPDGQPMDECDAYKNDPSGCPSAVRLDKGRLDSLSLRTLLYAAGVQSLDTAPSDEFWPGETMRATGVVLVASIAYSNYARPRGYLPVGTGSLIGDEVIAVYSVVHVSDSIFHDLVTVPDDTGLLLSPGRTVYNKTGVRLVFTQQGLIGIPSLQQTLINLTVALGLLSVAATVVSVLALYMCPLRELNRQLVTRPSLRMTDLRDADDREVLKRIAADPMLVNPLPPVLADLVDAKERRVRERMARLAAQKQGSDRSGADPGSATQVVANPSARASLLRDAQPQSPATPAGASLEMFPPAVRRYSAAPRQPPTGLADGSSGVVVRRAPTERLSTAVQPAAASAYDPLGAQSPHRQSAVPSTAAAATTTAPVRSSIARAPPPMPPRGGHGAAY